MSVSSLGFHYPNNCEFEQAHLSSDSGGKLRYGLRNANAASLLQSLVAASSDVGSDVQLGSHHTFVFGDLNYRELTFLLVFEEVVR